MSRDRAGRRQLGTLSEQLGERERAVLTAVGSHRYLTTFQVQRLCFVGHATSPTAARVCRRVLTRLHSQRILRRLERRIGGVRAGSASFVWGVGAVGDRLLRRDSGLGIRKRFSEPSETFLDHTLAVAETHISLVEASRRGDVELLSAETEPTCWRNFTGPGGAREVLRPDLAITAASAAFEQSFFVEVDRGTESLPTLLRKCAQYEAYRRSGREQQSSGSFPLVLWLLPNEAREQRLTGAIQRASQLTPALFRTAMTINVVAAVQQEIN